jgi:hypothetical protein
MKFILFLQKKWMGRRDQRGLGGIDQEDFARGSEAGFSDEVGLGGSQDPCRLPSKWVGTEKEMIPAEVFMNRRTAGEIPGFSDHPPITRQISDPRRTETVFPLPPFCTR